MSPSLSSSPMAYSTAAPSHSAAVAPMPMPLPSPSHALVPPPAASAANSPLAAIYASYVVRVHTRHGIKTLSFDHLAAFFTLTAKKAAEDLGISSRTLIRVCRSLGIRRWPYLGFRSEKNVERIRQEAIENLRRKLEKEGAASPTAVLYPNASSLRGASAKRLLQVKLPQHGHMSPLPSARAHAQHLSPTGSQSWSVQSIDDTESDDDTDVEMVEARVSPTSAGACAPLPLLTPQPMQHGFNLEVRSISPKKPFAVVPASAAHFQQPQLGGAWASRVPPAAHLGQLPSRGLAPFQAPPQPVLAKPSGGGAFAMPSLNLLVDASILTAFKHDGASSQQQPSQQQQAQCPRMSMRDILSHTAMAA